ncbi:MAG: SRPBCC domain-containing protein [Cyanobacteria bacterium P01_D01_bin.115]
MEIALYGLLLLTVVLLALVIFLPNVVRYSERIIVDAPIEQVYDNIRLQEDLMQWSAWPEATGSTCSLENIDGTVGARTVFFSQDKRFGHQEIIDLEPHNKVSMTLVNDGPLKHTPYLDFDLRTISDSQTEVTLQFVNTYQRPFQVPAKLLGIVKWTRELQIKDLEGLKTYSEL